MNSKKSVLRRCIDALVLEAIARPGAKQSFQRDIDGNESGHRWKRPQFKMNEFKALPDLAAMQKYADANLDFIGIGTARTVFRLTGKHVLKLANSMTKGVAQNKAELDVFTNPLCAPVVTKIYDYDTGYRWLVSEVVNPLSNEEEFQALADGLDWETFTDCLWQRKVTFPDPTDRQRELIEGAVTLMTKLQLEIGDVQVVGHWGKTADGRLVLMDYGFTSRVQRSYQGFQQWSDDRHEPKAPARKLSPAEQMASTQKAGEAPPTKRAMGEGLEKHARFAHDLYKRFIGAVSKNPETLQIQKLPRVGDGWILKCDSLGIPELSNVDIWFLPDDLAFAKDEPYGMYRPATKLHGPREKDIPESERRYRLQFSYYGETIWSRQKLVRLIPEIIDPNLWFHEVGHLLTARAVPTQPHVKNFFKYDDGGGADGDPEEVLGMFIQDFEKMYTKYGDKPDLFLSEFPTFKQFLDGLTHRGSHASILQRKREKFVHAKKRAQRWFVKNAFKVYADLSKKDEKSQ